MSACNDDLPSLSDIVELVPSSFGTVGPIKADYIPSQGKRCIIREKEIGQDYQQETKKEKDCKLKD
jgi:hypothetical protein